MLLRVGIDSGSGGIQGPIFEDGSFEYIPIPDMRGIDTRTYGNTPGRYASVLADYFPERRRPKVSHQPIHLDPEFETFTYGDPTSPKASLRTLQPGDFLAFYSGLEGWDFLCPPALYLIGYFEIVLAGRASLLGSSLVHSQFSSNFHVRNSKVYANDFARLVLVKGGTRSRFLTKAVKISSYGLDRRRRKLKILSREMRRIFGTFDGRLSIQRSPPRWVSDEFTTGAVRYLRALE